MKKRVTVILVIAAMFLTTLSPMIAVQADVSVAAYFSAGSRPYSDAGDNTALIQKTSGTISNYDVKLNSNDYYTQANTLRVLELWFADDADRYNMVNTAYFTMEVLAPRETKFKLELFDKNWSSVTSTVGVVPDGNNYVKVKIPFSDYTQYTSKDFSKIVSVRLYVDNDFRDAEHFLAPGETISFRNVYFVNGDPGVEYHQNKTLQARDALVHGINFSAMEGVVGTGYVQDISYYNIVKAAGFDHIRLPVNFAARCGSAPDYTIDSSFLLLVDNAINNALTSGLKVVLDFHGWSNICTDANGNKDEFYAIWKQVAERYQNYSDNLYFEILNEPNNGTSGADPLTYTRLNEIQMEAISIIRETNPVRMIMASVAQWNGAWMLNYMTLPDEDPNIMMSVHAYDPMAFSHQGATWAGFTSDQVAFTDDVKQAVDNTLNAVSDYTYRTGCKVWISEFGVYLSVADQSDVNAYLTYFTTGCSERGIPAASWEFCQGFGAYDLTNSCWRNYVLSGLIHN